MSSSVEMARDSSSIDSGDEFEPNAIGKSKYIPRPVWINPILRLG